MYIPSEMKAFRTNVMFIFRGPTNQSTIEPEIIATIHITKYGAADRNPFCNTDKKIIIKEKLYILLKINFFKLYSCSDDLVSQYKDSIITLACIFLCLYKINDHILYYLWHT